jgi:hypothetical protein
MASTTPPAKPVRADRDIAYTHAAVIVYPLHSGRVSPGSAGVVVEDGVRIHAGFLHHDQRPAGGPPLLLPFIRAGEGHLLANLLTDRGV